MTTAEVIAKAMELLDENDQEKLREILMGPHPEYTRTEAFADLDSLMNDRIDEELADIDLLKASGLRGPDLKDMLLLERALLRAKNAPGEIGMVVRFCVCGELAKLKELERE